MRSMTRMSLLLAVVLAAAELAVVARAELEPGRYRIYRMNNTYVEGDVTERPDAYEVKVGIGTVIIRKNEVKRVVPLEVIERRQEHSVPADEQKQLPAIRRQISDDEIEALLSGITAEYDPSIRGGTRDELMAPLPLDEQSLADMKRLMGPQAKTLEKDHFVMVYTSSDESARALGSRLEAVWRHNVNFMDRLELPAVVPDSKLEIFYFGTYKEFEAYNMNQGNFMPPGVLGYYSPEWNRSHFFDLNNSPYVDPIKEMLKDSNIPYDVKQRLRNKVRRWVEFQNLEVIQHETGHQIHFNIGLFPRDVFQGGSVPIWLVEGTTMLFEVPPTRHGASIGVLNHYRLYMLRKMFGFRPLTPSQWKLFIIDNSMWHGFESYQLGWALVYYLYKEHRDGYAQYLRSVFERGEGETMTNTDREKEFEDIFGRVDDKWVEDFYEFLNSLYVKKSGLPPDEEDNFDPSINWGAHNANQRNNDDNSGWDRPGRPGRGRR